MGVVGTAGHVDHGKSSLVRALTGIDPDRLREEKEREMTIDLGFAWLELPDGQRVGIVDVPGHKDFIKNMLAGIGSIDAALFVVAADEGVMPQTREHLDILDLLHVRAGIVALTKIDLVDDEDWLELVEADLAEQLEGTVLEHAPIIRVSARTQEGIQALKTVLAETLRSLEAREDRGRPRLPVDRVFSVAGFGTVVTGTLIDGGFQIGDEVEIQPRGLKGRIRGIQTHNEKLERAYPGSRVALNLTGISMDDVARGDVVAAPGTVRGTTMVDASLRYLPDAPLPLKHNALIDFFAGSAEIPAHIRLLDKQLMQPGDAGWVQLRLERPVAVLKGDRFIIRLPSPSITIGGGVVVDPHPRRRHRRFRPEVVQQLETAAFGTPVELLVQALQSEEPATFQQLRARTTLAEEEAQAALEESIKAGDVLVLSAGEGHDRSLPPSALLLSRGGFSRLREQIEHLLREYHRQYPLRKGMPREELKSRLQQAGKNFNRVVMYAAQAGVLEEVDGTVRLPGREVTFSPEQQAKVDALLAEFHAHPFTPPSVVEAEKLLGTELLNACFERGLLIKVSEDVALLPETYAAMVERIVAYVRQEGSITVAQVRDLFDTSRRYALALMSYLDQQGVTKRVGDERVLR